jgi:hypothetical protein
MIAEAAVITRPGAGGCSGNGAHTAHSHLGLRTL